MWTSWIHDQECPLNLVILPTPMQRVCLMNPLHDPIHVNTNDENLTLSPISYPSKPLSWSSKGMLGSSDIDVDTSANTRVNSSWINTLNIRLSAYIPCTLRPLWCLYVVPPGLHSCFTPLNSTLSWSVVQIDANVRYARILSRNSVKQTRTDKPGHVPPMHISATWRDF